jgi:EAL domain-containing protein (putative c-di-GMP-specific phosphodiesterase class I)/GGDEF domain-containing protein
MFDILESLDIAFFSQNIVLNIGALALMITVCVANRLKKQLKNAQNFRFDLSVWLILAACLINLLGETLIPRIPVFTQQLIFISGFIFTALQIACVLALLLYAMALLDLVIQKVNVVTKVAVAVLMVPFGIFAVSNQFVVALLILIVFLFIQKPEQDLDISTGLYNAAAFRKSFIINSHKWRQNQLILLLVEDIGILNRVMGVESTNQIVREIGLYLEQQYKGMVYYLGNEMFAILCAGDQDTEARRNIRRLDERFMEKWQYGRGETSMTARIIEIRLPEDAHELETIYSYGDYLRSLEDGHKWVLYARAVDMRFIKRRIDVDMALRRAILMDSFEMYYQPIYSVEEGRITTAEALVRLYDTDLGQISPGEFIPIAEQNGLILQVSNLIFENVFSFISRCNLMEKGIEYIEVNLSMVQCMQESFAETITQMMERYNVTSNRVNLEVTETAAVSMPRRLRENMHDLYDRGIRFSLDDFGTGYSNIDSLMDLPLDMIKLDKSMIDMASAEDKGKIVLASAVAMAKRIDMKIVAEGVETRDQKEYLEAEGVDYLQGYYFSKPLPEEEFVTFVENFNMQGFDPEI